MHPIIQSRSEFGEFHHLLQELREDEVRPQGYFRLSRSQFDDLLARVGARITLQDTNYRRSIPPEERLSICLRSVTLYDDLILQNVLFFISISTYSAG